MRVGIGQTEVDQIHVVAVVGQHDVGRLEIPVDNLLGVHVRKCVTSLVDYLDCQRLAYSAARKETAQRTPVYPLHLNAVAQRRKVDEGVVLADVRMIQ